MAERGAIRRQSLRDQVREALRERIVSGELAPEEVVREAAVSEAMGVSRTPLREAMIQLEREGLVRSAPSKGFSVAPLTAVEAREFFEMAGGIHALALLEGGSVGAERLAMLRASNEELGREGDAAAAVRRDSAWHRALAAGCSNGKITSMVEWLGGVLLRYDLAWARAAPEAARRARGDSAGHLAILEALEADDVQGAAGELAKHWRRAKGGGAGWLGG